METSKKYDYDILKNYAEYMFNRNLKVFTQNIFTPHDFLSEAYAAGFDNIDQAKKLITNLILKEKRRLISRIQQSENRSHFDVREKKCCDCGNPFPISEYYPRKDKDTGLVYYSSYCTECENARRRAAYAKSTIIKESARIRQQNWANRQREKKKLEAA